MGGESPSTIGSSSRHSATLDRSVTPNNQFTTSSTVIRQCSSRRPLLASPSAVLQEQSGSNNSDNEFVHSGLFDYFLRDQKAIKSVKFEYHDLQPTNEEVKLTKVLLCRRKDLPESEEDYRRCNSRLLLIREDLFFYREVLFFLVSLISSLVGCKS